MLYFFDQRTIGVLAEQFIISAANAKDGKGLRVFVKAKPEEALSIIHTALAQYVDGDVLMLTPKSDAVA